MFPFVGGGEPSVVLGTACGEEMALAQVGDDMLVCHADPIVAAIAGIGWLAVHVVYNDIATTGVRPRWILLIVPVPNLGDEDLPAQITRDTHHAARELGGPIGGGHTDYTLNLSRPLVAVAALGTAESGHR